MFLIPYFYAFRLTFNCWVFFLSTITIVFCNLNVILILFLKIEIIKKYIIYLFIEEKSQCPKRSHWYDRICIDVLSVSWTLYKKKNKNNNERVQSSYNLSKLHITLSPHLFILFFYCWPPTGLKIIQCTHILNRSLSSTNNTNQALRKTNKPINSYRVPFTTSVLTLEFLNFYYHSVYLSYAQEQRITVNKLKGSYFITNMTTP